MVYFCIRYNAGDIAGCASTYVRACSQALPLASGGSRAALQRALDTAQGLRGAGRDDEAAWALRRAFDAVLEEPKRASEVGTHREYDIRNPLCSTSPAAQARTPRASLPGAKFLDQEPRDCRYMLTCTATAVYAIVAGTQAVSVLTLDTCSVSWPFPIAFTGTPPSHAAAESCCIFCRSAGAPPRSHPAAACRVATWILFCRLQ